MPCLITPADVGSLTINGSSLLASATLTASPSTPIRHIEAKAAWGNTVSLTAWLILCVRFNLRLPFQLQHSIGVAG